MWRKFTVILMCIGGLLALGGGLEWDRSDHGGLALEKPSLLALAAEAEAQEEGVNFLQQEAGISAYVKLEPGVDLDQVRGAFKTVETVSDEYIIGEVALSDLPEDVHPHVYVDKEGWIVAYYSKDEPSSKFMQWIGYKGGAITTTTLEGAIRQIYDALGFPLREVKYFSFKHSTANTIMLITEIPEKDGEDTFYLTIPSGCRLFEVSWTHYGQHSRLDIDNTRLSTIGGDLSFTYGFTQLVIDVKHTVKVTRWRSYFTGTAIILIYRV